MQISQKYVKRVGEGREEEGMVSALSSKMEYSSGGI